MSGAGAGAANACFTCHGLDGRGNGAGSPRLAGLDAGYLERQLIAYADGRRQHASDGLDRPSSSTPDERRAVADYYAALPFEPASARSAAHVATLSPRRSRRAASRPARPAMASRAKAIGPANPPLAGQPAAYLAEQLELWRLGKRRNDPGGVMLRISQLLTPCGERALADYAAASVRCALPVRDIREHPAKHVVAIPEMMLQGRPYMCRNQHEQHNDRGGVHVLGNVEDAVSGSA